MELLKALFCRPGGRIPDIPTARSCHIPLRFCPAAARLRTVDALVAIR